MSPRRHKNLLRISLFITLLILSMSTTNVPISMSSPTTELAAPVIRDYNLTPESTFHINITVADVNNMGGYDLFLYYNTTVLTATNYSSYDPFNWEWPSEINDTLGYVAVSYTIGVGDPGFNATDPAPIARIDFTVDSYGSCLLDLRNTEIGDWQGHPIIHKTLDGFFANVPMKLHDITVKEVTANATGGPDEEVLPGDTVEINVTVFNGGALKETFNVTVKYDDTEIGTQTVTDLDTLAEETVSFSWNTTGVNAGYYDVEAEAILATDENPADNTGSLEGQVMIGRRDIAVIDLSASPTSVTMGDLVHVNATFKNLGNFTETFNVTVTFSGKDTKKPPGPDCTGEVGTKENEVLHPGVNKTLHFVWDTTGVRNYTYAIMAETTEVPDEFNTQNNKKSRVNLVTVNYPLGIPKVLGIDYSPKRPVLGETVTFNALSTDPDGYIVSWDWDFGDGTSGTGETTTHIYTTEGTYFVTLTVTDNAGLTSPVYELPGGLTVYSLDIAIVSVNLSATEVVAGESLVINVTIENLGDLPDLQTFNVTTYYDDTVINVTETRLAGALAHTTLTINWNTTYVDRGIYTIRAVASNLTRESQTDNNVLQFDGTVTVLAHDIAVTVVTTSTTEIVVGESVSINVTVENQGDFTETFNVTTYYDGNPIETQTNVSLDAGATRTLTFTWDTVDIEAGTYAISANATVVSGEVDTADNSHIGDTVTVKASGADFVLYLIAGTVIAIAAATILIYFLRVRKPKPT